MSQPFVHLHLHTEYSLLDGATRLDALLDKCKELNMPAVAVTDHGNMYCAWKFNKLAKEKGIKPIIGCEFYLCDDMNATGWNNKEYYHLILLAKNNVGYRNLVQLNSKAFVEGYYYKPRIDFNLLKDHAEGLICLSACIAGQLPRLLLSDRKDMARELAMQYKELFGEDYYIELQDHAIYEERLVMPQLIELARELDIPLVVTNDVHYLNEEDAEVQDIMLCVQTGKFFDDPQRMRFDGTSFYLKTREEMEQLFPELPEAVENTLKIAEKCNVELKKEELLPLYTTPDGSTPEQFFRKLVEEGLVRRYPQYTQEICDRVEYEYKVITSMGFVDYYLIVWDFINYAKTHGIPVGPGRGSGAGSVIAYCIGITEVEPFRYNLMFERFLNPERKTMPDFDVDFCMDRRGEVIEYVHKKYGNGNVSQIVTFGTMATKNAIRDVARVLRVPISEANRLTKMVPDMFKYTLKHLLGKVPYKKVEDTFVSQELIDAYNAPETHKVLDVAMRLEGAPRQTGMHAAGVVICRDKISNHVPLQTNGGALRNGGIVTTQYNMIEVEEAGLLKMDFLGLRTLTDIKKALDYVEQQTGKRIVFTEDSYNDPEVFKTISSGDTMCIFQLESGGMSDLMKRMQPDGLEDIIAGISLYRPGPMQFIGNYIEGKFNKQSIKYTHPMMEPILSITNGCIVYQEQVMQIVKALAGFSTALADNVRYAMSKKKFEMMKELGQLFIYGGTATNGEAVKGCIANGIPEATAKEIYDELIDFSQYAFNKSHAACYAYVCYQTAYLKRYYPVELLCAMLNNRIDNIKDIKKYLNYAKSKNIPILPPDINKSAADFTVDHGALRFGLGGIKNIGVSVVAQIVAERERAGEFSSMKDLFERAGEFINKRMIENLIKSGAFDCFERTRADMLQYYQDELAQVQESVKKHASGQISIFDMAPELKAEDNSSRTMVKEFAPEVKYSYEKEALGMYLSGSPLDDYDKYKAAFHFDFSTEQLPHKQTDDDEYAENSDVSNVEANLVKRKVVTGGILHDVRVVKGKDNAMMGFGVLEDVFDSIEVALYSPMYDKYKTLFVEDAFLVIKGTISESRDGYKINIRELINPKSEQKPAFSANNKDKEERTTLCLLMEHRQEDVYNRMLSVLEQYRGDMDVMLRMEGKKYKLDTKVRQCNGIMIELQQLLGDNNVVFYTKDK